MIRPLGNKVCIEIEKAEEKTKGGIILPDVAKEEKSIGKVVSLGRDVVDLEYSDNVIFGKYSGDVVFYEGKEYRVVSEDDILAKVRK